MIAHSSDCIPPIDPPTTASQREMPSPSATMAWVRTMSRVDTVGNRAPEGSPSAGLIDEGPVVPWQPPRALTQTTM